MYITHIFIPGWLPSDNQDKIGRGGKLAIIIILLLHYYNIIIIISSSSSSSITKQKI